MGLIAYCKSFFSDVLSIASNEGVVSLVKNTAANPNYVFEKIAEFDAEDELLNEIDEMVANLRLPAKKEAFFKQLDAKVRLMILIEDAKKFGLKSALRHLEDYLADLERWEREQKYKSYEMLKALIEKEGTPRYYQPIIEERTQEPLEREEPVEVIETQPVVLPQPPLQTYDLNALWEPYLDLELDELCNKFSELTIDSDPFNPLVEPKRLKECHEDLGDIPSLEMMDRVLSFRIACDKREIQLIQQILGENQDNKEKHLKRVSIIDRI